MTVFFFLYIAVHAGEDVSVSRSPFFSKALTGPPGSKANHLQHQLNKAWSVCLPIFFQTGVRMGDLPLEGIHLAKKVKLN